MPCSLAGAPAGGACIALATMPKMVDAGAVTGSRTLRLARVCVRVLGTALALAARRTLAARGGVRRRLQLWVHLRWGLQGLHGRCGRGTGFCERS